MLPKHSEQRCGSSRSRRLPEGKDTEGNIYRRRGRRINTANHFMPIYKFYQDVLCTSWERRHFTVTAQNQEDGEIKLPGKEVYHV